MKKEYITEINKRLPNADLELLDFIFQLLQKTEQTSPPLETTLQLA